MVRTMVNRNPFQRELSLSWSIAVWSVKQWMLLNSKYLQTVAEKIITYTHLYSKNITKNTDIYYLKQFAKCFFKFSNDIFSNIVFI